jgi:hypothetical protein
MMLFLRANTIVRNATVLADAPNAEEAIDYKFLNWICPPDDGETHQELQWCALRIFHGQRALRDVDAQR